MDETKKLDIRTKKTEAEWSKAMDNWFLYATPTWFEWLKWIIIMGAIQVVASKTQQDRLVQLVLGTSNWLFMFYMMAFFYRLEFHGFPLIKGEKTRRTVSIILSGILALGTYHILVHLSQIMQI